jgi:putative redox protein
MAAQGRPIALMVGHSLGGAAVLAAAADMPSVKAVVTIGAPSDVNHVLHQFKGDSLDRIATAGEAEVQLGRRPFVVSQAFIDDLPNHDLIDRVATLHRPLLVMHAPGDDTVGIENAAAIYAAAKHPKSFVSLDGSDHLVTRRGDADYVAGMIAVWFRRYLNLAE